MNAQQANVMVTLENAIAPLTIAGIAKALSREPGEVLTDVRALIRNDWVKRHHDGPGVLRYSIARARVDRKSNAPIEKVARRQKRQRADRKGSAPEESVMSTSPKYGLIVDAIKKHGKPITNHDLRKALGSGFTYAMLSYLTGRLRDCGHIRTAGRVGKRVLWALVDPSQGEMK
jgi:hypothetical protein